MEVRRSCGVSVVGVLLLLLVLGVGATAVVAQEGTKQVGLVIALPEGEEHLEVVEVPADASAFDVLEASSVELASQTTDFGPAVCGINEVGCPPDNCFCDAERFWAYYHLDPAAGEWVAAAEGVGAYVPADGAVEGFAWSEADENFVPVVQPAVHTFDDIAGQSADAEPMGTAQRVGYIALGVVLIGAAFVILRRGRRAGR